jgi:hypothetical protein
MKKPPPTIDPSILKSFRKIAVVLGMSAREFVEEELERRATEVDEMTFGELVEQFFSGRLFASRKSAEAMAERLEAFAVDANLEEGRENSGAIATSVVQRDGGAWMVEIHYLRPTNGKWERVSVDQVEDDEGEEWRD